MKGQINFSEAKKQLAIASTVMAVLLVIIFISQFIPDKGRYFGVESEAWGWFLPNIMPILSIIISGLFTNKNETNNDRMVLSFYLNFARFIAVFYFLLVLFVMLIYSSSKGNIIDYYNKWNILLAPMQSFASIGIGYFFYRPKST